MGGKVISNPLAVIVLQFGVEESRYIGMELEVLFFCYKLQVAGLIQVPESFDKLRIPACRTGRN
ncbi:hypothetical protein ED312_05060 [Sinomicrobium pectinilyticum]|uniref:Uncharacterized protein n=1 Tax=Sinomicrobium pectinilyticum TaxID=1084421 RepID=A0A3N0ETF6_SINP1|nr:hypothetical protein ED312_05060 [Sinomicrobium pectinilyticum]